MDTQRSKSRDFKRAKAARILLSVALMRALTFSSLGLLALCTACTVTNNSGEPGSGTTGTASAADTAHSDTVATRAMHPSLSAQDYGDGSGVHVYAAWLDDNGRWLQTSGGDVAEAARDSQAPEVLFVESDVPGKVHYTTTFPSIGAAQNIGIGLTRPSGKVSAPGSTAIVGAPFLIVTTLPLTIQQGDKIAIEVSPPPAPDTVGDGDSWQLTASGACIQDFMASSVSIPGAKERSTLLDANGRFVFDTARLSNAGSTTCDVTIMVKHLHYSQLDPAYGSAAAGLELLYADAPLKDGDVDRTYAVEGLQARAVHTTFRF